MKKSKWTKELCQEEALKYETRIEFSKKSCRAYNVACKNKWLSDICIHMKKIGNRLFRCIYVYEFPNNYAYIGLTYNLQKRNIERKTQKNDSVTLYINETNLTPILKQLTEYVPVIDAILLEDEYIEIYRNNGWNILNKVKGGAIGFRDKLWTKEMCHQEAIKYDNRTDFYEKSNKAHIAACRYGWLNEICSHMKIKNKHWTIEECINEALKYNTRNEFILNNKAAYIWATRHNILNEICSHMKCAIGTNQFKKILK